MADTAPDLPVTMKVYSQSNTFLCEFPFYTNLSVMDLINDVGSFSFSWNLNSPGASNLISDTALQMAVCIDFKDGNGFTEVWRGLYEQDTYDPSMNESALVQANGRSMVAILDQAVVYPQAGLGSTTTSWSFTGASPGNIMNTLITAAKARGCFPSLTTTFTNGQDSSGAAWLHGYTNAFSAGTSYLSLLIGLAQGGLCDFNMTGTALNIYNPGTTLATDRSTTVVLRRAREIITVPTQRDRTQLGTAMLAIGDNGLNVEVTAPTLGTLGRYETYLGQGGVNDSATLTSFATQAIASVDDQQISQTPTGIFNVNLGTPRPWKDFFPGDYISIDVSGTPTKYRATTWTMQASTGGPTFFQPTLNDVFYDREVLFNNQLNNITGGSVTGIGGTAITVGQPIPGPNPTIPGVPAFVAASTYTAAYYSPATGTTLAQIELQWTTPTNTDGTTMIDGANYIIQYRIATVPIYPILWSQLQGKPWSSINGNPWTNPLATPQNQQWTTVQVNIDSNNTIISGLICGETYQFQIACTDVSGNTGLFSSVTPFVTATDNVAPVQPDAPTVAASMVAVQVMHDLGSASGGTYNLAQDLDHLEVHFSYDPSFVPVPGIGSATYLGKLIANAGMMAAHITAVGTFQVTSTTGIYIKVIAVDESGNSSPASPGSGVTAILIDDQHISSLSVSKLIAGTISATVILGSSIGTATSGARVVMDGTTDALYTYDSGGNLIGAWAGASGSDPSTSKTFVAGWSIFNDPGTGYFQVVSNTPGAGFTYSSPVLQFSGGTANSTPASMYANTGAYDWMHLEGPITNSDTANANASVQMIGSFAGAGTALGYISYRINNTNIRRIQWDQDGLVATQGPYNNQVTGNLIQHTGMTAGLSYRYICYGVISGTTNGSGQLTFAHGAPFTPGFILTSNANAFTNQLYVTSIGATNATVTCYTVSGGVAASTLVNFWIACIGD